MSVSTSDEWVCDRCGRKTLMYHGSGSREQPVGWAAIHVVMPPLMNPTESDKQPDQVCADCVRAYGAWFTRGRDQVSEADHA